MSSFCRRRLLALVGGSVTALAGCSDRSSAPADDLNAHALIDGTTVIYPEAIEGAGAVETADGRVGIAYDDPASRFTLGTVYKEDTKSSAFLARRELGTDALAGFIAPVYAGDGEFVYHVFVNERTVSFAEWELTVRPAGDIGGIERRVADFESVADGVFHNRVGPADIATIGIEAHRRDGEQPQALTAFGLTHTSALGAPATLFGFDYESDTEELTVTHRGGDDIDGDRLDIVFEGEAALEDGFNGTVSVGDSATLSAGQRAIVRLIWTDESETRSHTLDHWNGPRARLEARAPSIEFAFQYDPETEQLDIIHQGHEAVEAETLEFISDGDFEVIEDFTGEVTTGDRATLAVSADVTVEIIWIDSDERLRLDSWDGA